MAPPLGRRGVTLAFRLAEQIVIQIDLSHPKASFFERGLAVCIAGGLE